LPQFPKKLKILAGRDKNTLESKHDKPHIQEHYYETGSESGTESEGNEKLKRKIPEGNEKILHDDFENIEEPGQSEGNKKEIINEKIEASKNYLQKSGAFTKEVMQRKYVPVERSAEVSAKRAKLPIFAEEQFIVETINDNVSIIICGETGSGKTTQLPQFLYEAGYTSNNQMIGITEPRRVAAISMANRVGFEMNLPKAVSYQIRYEGTRSPDTQILFMTDGVLMKEIQKDIMLSAYSVIIIDEAHERSMYSDVLIGLLSRIAPHRTKIGLPFKLIIMSATLHLEHFTQKSLFPLISPPVIHIDSRQYAVTVHFERRTPNDYLNASFRKICKIHENLPMGTILVFLSGRLEVSSCLLSLYALQFITSRNETDERNVELNEFGIADTVDLACEMDLEMVDDIINKPPPKDIPPLFCLPLFSLLSSEKQKRIFEPSPEGCRMCIIATNVAETSITIPAVRYIVDSGREKRRIYDPVTGVSQFIVHWISQASAEQRAGRAGRVQAGHAYRLYSSALFADMEKFSPPEILNKPVDQLVLHMKSMNIVKIANFPFPTRPDQDALEESEKRLILLGALEKEARITPLGRTLSMFPLAPKYAKILVMANQNGLLPYACLLVAILSVREPLISVYSLRGETNDETQSKMYDALKQRRDWCGQGQSRRFGDLSVMLKHSEEVCQRRGVRFKALTEIIKLYQQLMNLISSSCVVTDSLAVDFALNSPSDEQFRMLRQIVIASLTDNIVRRIDRSTTTEEIPKGAYESQRLKEYLFIDPSSVLFKEEPEWILYQEIIEINGKKCMQNVITVEPDWLARLALTYCDFVEIKNADPKYDPASDSILITQNAFFGSRRWSLGVVNRPIPRDINLYRQFARFFLDGSVCPKLAEYSTKLLSSPMAMVRPWAKLQARTENLLNALIEYEVSDRKSLIEMWKSKHEYLLDEFLEWIPRSLHDAIQLLWPPL
uniref:RNA helicase n=1 Tax=Dracunculus medinensis TaxID=318479 RepID=A0A158Q2M2_DRAME